MKKIILLFIALIGCSAFFYGEPVKKSSIKSVIWENGTYNLVILVGNSMFSEPKGIAKFPDGGEPKVYDKKTDVYLGNAKDGAVKKLLTLDGHFFGKGEEGGVFYIATGHDDLKAKKYIIDRMIAINKDGSTKDIAPDQYADASRRYGRWSHIAVPDEGKLILESIVYNDRVEIKERQVWTKNNVFVDEKTLSQKTLFILKDNILSSTTTRAS